MTLAHYTHNSYLSLVCCVVLLVVQTRSGNVAQQALFTVGVHWDVNLHFHYVVLGSRHVLLGW